MTPDTPRRPALTRLLALAGCLLWLPLQAQDDVLPMQINFGVSGGWKEATTTGQGFAFEIIPDFNLLGAYWFTFGTVDEDRQAWYVASGDISGAVATLTIAEATGGVFDDPAPVSTEAVGSAVLTFEDCSNATLEYQFDDGRSGAIELDRITPDVYCTPQLAEAHLTAVSHSNRWVPLTGNWRFQGCVNLDGGDSHGTEWMRFGDGMVTLEIDNYALPDCQGAVTQQVLEFEMIRVDKTSATRSGQPVIANRFVMRDPDIGTEIRQIWYVDDRGALPRVTHGILDSPADADGFPTQVHNVLATRVQED